VVLSCYNILTICTLLPTGSRPGNLSYVVSLVYKVYIYIISIILSLMDILLNTTN
jgi:hypothetical protein